MLLLCRNLPNAPVPPLRGRCGVSRLRQGFGGQALHPNLCGGHPPRADKVVELHLPLTLKLGTGIIMTDANKRQLFIFN